MSEGIYVNRKGEFVSCDEGYNEQGLPISIGYTRRLVEHARVNCVYHIDLEEARRTPATMRMMFNKVGKELNKRVRTFMEDESTMAFAVTEKIHVLI